MTTRLVTALVVYLAAGVGCAGSVRPQEIGTSGGITCTSCRMTLSQPRFAAQLVAPGEDPLFFDDIGCLAAYLNTNTTPSEIVVYVADYQSGEWLNARDAVYARDPTVETPMSSHILAFRDPIAATAGASAAREVLATAQVFGSGRVPAR